MKEKRKLERFDLELPATIQFLTPGQEKSLLNLLTTNISSGGAYFHTPQPLPKGTPVKIDLILPLGRLKKLKDDSKQAYIKVTGTVLRSESEGMAICFDQDYQLVGVSQIATPAIRSSSFGAYLKDRRMTDLSKAAGAMPTLS